MAPSLKRRANDNNNGGNGENGAPSQKRKRYPSQPQFSVPQRPHVVGKVVVCGQGNMGQLGLGDHLSKYECKRPAVMENVFNAVDVKAGGMHSLILTHDGKVFSFGCNDEGALGRDSSELGSEFEPYSINLPGKVVKISAGDSHSACLLDDGSVYAWGSFRDSQGNMGLTLEGNTRTPIKVLPGRECCDIASGANHLVLLTCEGLVYSFGCGEQGQLGRVSLRTGSGESRRGKTELLNPALVITRGRKLIDTIWATNLCTFMREYRTGQIWAFGLNNYQQLLGANNKLDIVIHPIKTKIDNVEQISGGPHHTMVLKDDGSVLVIGRKDYGRLGLGELSEDLTELKPVNALSEKQIVSISCGEAQSFAITDDGKLYSWGMGSNYQLGTGNGEDCLEPKLINIIKKTVGKRIICADSGGQHSLFLMEQERQPAAEEVEEEQVKKPNKVKNKNEDVSNQMEDESIFNIFESMGETILDMISEVSRQPPQGNK